MKKRLKKWMLPLFTLMLVAVGAAMPFIAAYMQDAQQADPDIRPFDSFSLTLQQRGAGLGRLLRAIANREYYINETPALEDTALTQGLALAAVEDLMDELVKYGLLRKEALAQFSDPKVHPQLVIPVVYADTNIDTAAAVLPGPDYDPFPGDYTEEAGIPTWTVTWDQPDDCHVWLDDASGKAIYIEIPSLSDMGKPDGSGAFGEKTYALAENWRAFLSDYYGTEAQITDEEWYDDDAVSFALSFPLGVGEDKEIFQLDLYLYFKYHFSVLSPYVS